MRHTARLNPMPPTGSPARVSRSPRMVHPLAKARRSLLTPPLRAKASHSPPTPPLPVSIRATLPLHLVSRPTAVNLRTPRPRRMASSLMARRIQVSQPSYGAPPTQQPPYGQPHQQHGQQQPGQPQYGSGAPYTQGSYGAPGGQSQGHPGYPAQPSYSSGQPPHQGGYGGGY